MPGKPILFLFFFLFLVFSLLKNNNKLMYRQKEKPTLAIVRDSSKLRPRKEGKQEKKYVSRTPLFC